MPLFSRAKFKWLPERSASIDCTSSQKTLIHSWTRSKSLIQKMGLSTLAMGGIAVIITSCGVTPKSSPEKESSLVLNPFNQESLVFEASPGSILKASTSGNPKGNPFEKGPLFVNPEYQKSLEQAAARLEDTELRERAKSLMGISTAIWIDRIKHIERMEPALQKAMEMGKNPSQPDQTDQYRTNQPAVVTFVVYNLPERDCAAKSSAGELKLNENGWDRYRFEYIDAIRAILVKYPTVPVALMIEPDSLPNLATNLNVPKCAGAQEVYRNGVAYALRSLNLPNTTLYLDVAHGGWLGWPDNREKIARIFSEVLQSAGGQEMIRGFVTNVSNYSPLSPPVPDLPDSYYNWNPARGELLYVDLLRDAFARVGITQKAFVIDTSRNGNPRARSNWANWCNVKNARIGEKPRVNPAPGIDAFLWVKPPGESDGTTDTSGRFDSDCLSPDSLIPAPEAGTWFQTNFEILISK